MSMTAGELLPLSRMLCLQAQQASTVPGGKHKQLGCVCYSSACRQTTRLGVDLSLRILLSTGIAQSILESD
jgi:hypothetical protein